MTTRLWLCLLGIHAWTTAIGPGLYAQTCRHCEQPRTR